MIPVRLTGHHEGVVVLHTRAEWDALIAGVDRQAADAHGAPLEWLDEDGDAVQRAREFADDMRDDGEGA